MRQRQLRFTSVVSVAEPTPRHPRAPDAATAKPDEEVVVKPDELTDWDWAVFLLHTAAEVEHALMTQYLFAAYSLGPPFRGSQVPPDAATRVTRWQNIMLGIGREEMAHLATVQNVLRLIGGSLNFEREDFPFRSQLYPFPFRLEPLSKPSLAKYAATEMPADPPEHPDQPGLAAEIVQRAGGDGHPVNRVGLIYGALIDVLGDAARIPDADLRPATAETLQARAQDWSGNATFLVREVATREQAVAALDLIARQGEGPAEPSGPSAPSHYARLRDLYREFPETDDDGGDAAWVPARPLPDNPNTLAGPSPDPEVEASRITDPASLLWAQLFNLRYRMLLLDLAHAFHLNGDMGEHPDRTARGRLRDGALVGMRGRTPQRRSGLRGLARKLTSMPLKEGPASETAGAVAGPPFELPYSVAVPDQEHDRWRLHQALLTSSMQLVERIRSSGDDPVLEELEEEDGEMRQLVADQLVAFP